MPRISPALIVILANVASIRAFPFAQDPFATGPSIVDTTNVSPSCSVKLFESFTFVSFRYLTSFYSPDCQGNEWDRIILNMEGSANGTNQFDRVGAIWLDQVEILRFSTPEPPEKSVAWNVQRDLSVYGSYFEQEHTVHASCGNVVNNVYNGVIEISATLNFYKNVSRVDAADFVLGINSEAGGFQDSTIKSNASLLSNFGLPFRNANRAYLDVYASGHGCEEFWYSNPPDDSPLIPDLTDCGGGSSRQFLVTLDEMIVGVQTPFPVVYTGGINPLFWRPQTGIYSFNIPPCRFDLTPFVGILNDGNNHTIGISVLNNTESGVWYITPVLVTWQDKHEDYVEGTLDSYSFDFGGPITTTSETESGFEWNETYSATLFASAHLLGNKKGSIANVSTSSQVQFTNRNIFNYTTQNQVTDFKVDMELSSSAFTRNHVVSYPFYSSITTIFNDTGFSIISDINYSVVISSYDVTEDSALFYQNTMAGDAIYSENTVNGLTNKDERGITSQTYSIEKSNKDCFSQDVLALDGFVTNYRISAIPGCIPETFCAEFDACAFPAEITSEEFQGEGLSKDNHQHPFRCPPLLQCSRGDDYYEDFSGKKGKKTGKDEKKGGKKKQKKDDYKRRDLWQDDFGTKTQRMT